MATSSDWQRLAALVSERRGDLALTQEDVRAAGGPSTATQRLIERGQPSHYQPRILAGLETALGWHRGSIRRILGGGDPVLAPDALAPAPLPAVPEPPREIPETPGDDVRGAVVAALYGPAERRIWSHIRRCLAGTPAGRELFSEPAEVATWPPESPDGLSGGAPFDLTEKARDLLDATPATGLFTDPYEVIVWRMNRLKYRKRVGMIRELREAVREPAWRPSRPSTARRVGLEDPPHGLTA